MNTVDYSDTVPIQYVEGKASFLGMDIKVDPRVLIPRPETELLVNIAAEFCGRKKWDRPAILDVGTGSGNIPLGLLKLMPASRVVASDVSPDALSAAQSNVKRFNREENIELVLSDMFGAFGSSYDGTFNGIVSNPPYISECDYGKLDEWVLAEPRIALYGGKEGMDYLNILACQSARLLVPGGFIAVEVGYDQPEKMKKCLSDNGFKNITAFRDFNNYERVITGWKNG